MIARDPALDRRIWMLAWPLLLSNITAPLLGLVDTAVVGHLDSPVYLAAVALGSNVFMFLYFLIHMSCHYFRYSCLTIFFRAKS